MKFRQSVYIILKKGNKVLITKGNKNNIDFWNFPGGGIEGEESIFDAFYREAYEELGLKKEDFLDVKDTNLVNKYVWPDFIRKNKDFDGQEKRLMIGIVKDEIKIDTSITNEISEFKWVEKEKLLDSLHHPELASLALKVL
ncbi:MAG: NUDIX hydrolase [Candidatus Woesearchaeota archaeon]